jgi:hypothetical protein
VKTWFAETDEGGSLVRYFQKQQQVIVDKI